MLSLNKDKWFREGFAQSPANSDFDYSEPVPVLVFGSGVTALGVIRCFGRSGIPVYGMSCNAELISHSRWFKRLGQPPRTIVDANCCEDFLKSLPIDKGVLIPCSDEWTVALSQLPDDVCLQFTHSLAPPAVLEAITDKGKFSRCLEIHGIPHPETTLIESTECLEKIQIQTFDHYFLKPHDSQRFFSCYGKKAFRVHSRQQAIEHYQQFKQDGFDVLLQEYIPGGSDQHYFIDGFVDRNGVVKSVFARRRLRMYPPDFGNSSHMISISLDSVESAVHSLTRLLEAIKFRGIFSTEFKFDHRDGVYKVIEINARPWWFVGFAEDCGVPVCLQAYQDALGKTVDTVSKYDTNVPFVHAYYDFHACIMQYREGRLSIIQWVKTWALAKTPIFAADDPFPAIFTFIKRAYGYLSKSMAVLWASRV